mgnify:CR=1 FL=1
MNLELLLSMSKAYADDSLQNIACTHANTTILNHFRDDYSTYHLVDYDPETGAVRGKQTVQGFSDDSSWSRGQAWALYSYTMMFRLTGYQNYLLQAGHIADMLLRRLPADGIPYWDFDAPVEEHSYRDASAAAIMASAFIELSRYIPGTEAKESYLAMAEKQLRTLASKEYLAEPDTNGNFLLKHSVGALPDKKRSRCPPDVCRLLLFRSIANGIRIYKNKTNTIMIMKNLHISMAFIFVITADNCLLFGQG